MKVTILGCGPSTGVPSIGGADGRGEWGACDPAEPRNRRSRSAIVVHAPAGNILVDAGPDIRRQLLDAEIGRIDALLVTHGHADHINGLDDVRMLNRVTGAPMPTYASARTIEELRLRFGYAFRAWTPPHFYWPVLDVCELAPGGTALIAGAAFSLFDYPHYGQRTLGFRTGGFAYTTDVADLEAEGLAALAGLDTWVVGCLQRAPHPAHVHLERVVGWARDLGVRRTVLTHMGHDLDWRWMREHLPPGIEAAYDGMVIAL